MIDWRGPVAPAFTNYAYELGEDDDTAVLELGDCNSCHAAASSDDCVFSTVLSLDSL